MKLPVLIIPLTWVAVAIGAYTFGRNHGTRSEDARTAAPAGSQSMLGTANQSPRNRLDSAGGEIPINENLDGRALIDALIANQTAVPAEHMSLAVLKAAGESDPVRSNLMFAQLLQLLTPENAGAALEALAELPRSSLIDNQMRLFRFAWGQIDGPSAAEYVSKISGRNGNYAAYSIMSGWASSDPDAAIAWTNALEVEDEKTRGSYFRGIVGGLAKTDPERATRFALDRHAAGDKEADDYVEMIAREQHRRGLETVTAWIETLTATELKQDAVFRVSRDMVQRDPEKAAQWVEAYVGNEFAVTAIGEVADEWAEDDAPSAAAWVASLPPGDARTRAFGETFNEWTEDDPFAAADYLVTMPMGADRDAGASALSRRHVRDDPEAAVTWADSITDDTLRASTLTYTAQQWMRREPEKARAWLETSGLPDEVRQKIENTSRNSQQFQIRYLDGEMRGFGGSGGSGGSGGGGGVIDVRGGRSTVIIRE